MMESMLLMSGTILPVRDQLPDDLFYMKRRDHLGTLEIALAVGMAWTPHVICPLEIKGDIVGASVADIAIDHPIGRGEFVIGFGKAADQHDGAPCCPGQPGKPA